MTTTTQSPRRPEDLPIWARLQLAKQGVPFRRVTHWIDSDDGRTIGAAVNGQPVYLTR